jgi:hypothetical protein
MKEKRRGIKSPAFFNAALSIYLMTPFRLIYSCFLTFFAAIALNQAIEIPRLLFILDELHKSARDQGQLVVWLAGQVGSLKAEVARLPQSAAAKTQDEAEKKVNEISARLGTLESEVKKKESYFDKSITALIAGVIGVLVAEIRVFVKARIRRKK